MTMMSWLGFKPTTFLSGALAVLAMTVLWPACGMAEEPAPGNATENEAAPAPEKDAAEADMPAVSGPPWELLEKGRQAYEYGDYLSARQFLDGALRGNLSRESRIEAYMLLGQCHYLLRAYSAAKDAFGSLLRIDPDYQPDPVMVPPTIMGFFERLREDMEPQLKPLRERLAREKAAQHKTDTKKKSRQPKKVRVVEKVVRKNSRVLNFLPFGVGQFQNGETGKGIGIMTSEIAVMGLNLASYIAIKALAGADGKYTPEKAATAKNLRIVQYSAAGAFVALWIYGIIDGLVYYQPETAMPPNVTTISVPAHAPAKPETDMMFTGNGVMVTF